MGRRVERGIAVGFGVALIMLTIVSGLAIWNANRLTDDDDWVSHTYRVISDIENIFSAMQNAETGQRGYVLTGKDTYLAPYTTAVAAIDPQLQRLRGMIADNPDQIHNLDDLEPLIMQKLTELKQTIDLRKTSGLDAALQLVNTDQGLDVMNNIRQVVSRMEDAERGLLDARISASRSSSHMMTSISVTATVLSLGVLAIGFLLLREDIARRRTEGLLRQSNDVLEQRVAARTVELAQANQSLQGEVVERRQAEQAAYESREWFQTMLLSIGDAVIVADTKTKIIIMNPVAQALTGWSQSDAIGKPLAEVFNIVNEYSRQIVESPVDRVIREGVIVGLANHTILITKDGKESPIDDSGAPIRDNKGSISGVILVFRDISERKEAETQRATLYDQAVDASSRIQRLQAVTASLSQALSIPDVARVFSELAVKAGGAAAGVFVRLTDQRVLEVVEALNYSASDLRTWHQFPLDLPVPLAEAVKTMTPIWITAPQEWIDLYPTMPPPAPYQAWVALPLIVADKAVGGIGFSFTDTQPFRDEDKALMIAIAAQCAQALERARLYSEVQTQTQVLQLRVAERTTELEDALGRAQTADRAKSIMLSNVSHEMRTPLSSIIGFSNLMLSRSLPETKINEFTTLINSEARRLAHLINEFLDLQRIESGRETFQYANIDLAELVRDVISKQVGEGSQHVLELALTPVPPVYADAERIRRVIVNLLSNAVKFSPGGGKIVISVWHKDNEVLFSIRDSGLGIPSNELNKLFERFQRGNAAELLRIQGTGLGLALCRNVMEVLHGRIWAESDGEGKGATFTFALPLKSVDTVAN